MGLQWKRTSQISHRYQSFLARRHVMSDVTPTVIVPPEVKADGRKRPNGTAASSIPKMNSTLPDPPWPLTMPLAMPKVG